MVSLFGARYGPELQLEAVVLEELFCYIRESELGIPGSVPDSDPANGWEFRMLHHIVKMFHLQPIQFPVVDYSGFCNLTHDSDSNQGAVV